jgi:hypothetical protein
VEIQMSRALLPVTVTDVDELHWVGRLAGGEDPAAGCDPPWPVGETVGSVVRTTIRPARTIRLRSPNAAAGQRRRTI